MDKLEELKTALHTAYNTFFETDNDDYIDKFYQSNFTFCFNDKTTGKTHKIDMYCSPDIWDKIFSFIDSLENEDGNIF